MLWVWSHIRCVLGVSTSLGLGTGTRYILYSVGDYWDCRLLLYVGKWFVLRWVM